MIDYQPIIQSLSNPYGQQVDVLRLDLIHPEISGNKWFKLKHNVERAISLKHDTVITFGGAFSNHIAATAACCKLFGLKAIGVIRGEEPRNFNSTLSKARENGMQLHFVSREQYAQKDGAQMHTHLRDKFGDYFTIPEGGANLEGIMGCQEIMDSSWNYDYVFCACGTATTYCGILSAMKPDQKLIGVSVLKGQNKLAMYAQQVLSEFFPEKNFKVEAHTGFDKDLPTGHFILDNYCFSGYAKCDKELLDFKQDFERDYRIPLDYVYTNKLFYAVFDLIKNSKLTKSSRILVVHSGGLQGNEGFEARFGRQAKDQAHR